MSHMGHQPTFERRSAIFRYSPESGLKWHVGTWPLRATTGLMHRSKRCHSFDHLVGESEQLVRHSQSERLGRFQVDD